MKFIRSESLVDYATYTFNYALYMLFESGDSFSEIYKQGFLPYTGDVSRSETLLYMARSIRIKLQNFVFTSENRRLLRKVEGSKLSIDLQSTEELRRSSEFLEFCRRYIVERIGIDKMSDHRLEYILSSPIATDVLTFKLNGKPIAYILGCLDDQMLHYWFAFFDTSKLADYPIGKWVMLETILWAQHRALSYVYLGTCYGSKALYKVRDHKGAEWWDGNVWNSDIALLKNLCKQDDQDKPDRLKRESDFIDKL